MQNVLDWAISICVWWAVGFALATTPGNAFFGTHHWFLHDVHDPLEYSLFLLKLGFAATSTTIVSGAVAERCKLQAYIIFVVIFTSFTCAAASASLFKFKQSISRIL